MSNKFSEVNYVMVPRVTCFSACMNVSPSFDYENVLSLLWQHKRQSPL